MAQMFAIAGCRSTLRYLGNTRSSFAAQLDSVARNKVFHSQHSYPRFFPNSIPFPLTADAERHFCNSPSVLTPPPSSSASQKISNPEFFKAKVIENTRALPLPKFSPCMTRGRVDKWLAKAGQIVPKYSVVAEVFAQDLLEPEVTQSKDIESDTGALTAQASDQDPGSEDTELQRRAALMQLEIQEEDHLLACLLVPEGEEVAAGTPAALFVDMYGLSEDLAAHSRNAPPAASVIPEILRLFGQEPTVGVSTPQSSNSRTTGSDRARLNSPINSDNNRSMRRATAPPQEDLAGGRSEVNGARAPWGPGEGDSTRPASSPPFSFCSSDVLDHLCRKNVYDSDAARVVQWQAYVKLDTAGDGGVGSDAAGSRCPAEPGQGRGSGGSGGANSPRRGSGGGGGGGGSCMGSGRRTAPEVGERSP